MNPNDKKKLNTFIETISTPKDLLTSMRSFRYGFIGKNGQVFTKWDEDTFNKNYRLMQPENVLKHKIGTCNEQALFEYACLNEKCTCKLFSIHQYYASQHTFLLYHDGKSWYWFENAFQKFRGIHGPYPSTSVASKAVLVKMELAKPTNKGHNLTEINPASLLGNYDMGVDKFLRIAGFDFSKA